MRKLAINSFIFSSPLLICLLFFVADDPFGIFYKDLSLAERSEDVVKTREYLRSFKGNNNVAFVFGNSRGNAFREVDWKKYIDAEYVFNYSCPGESILNIRKKLELITSNQRITNALILIDAGILENTNNSHRFYKGPVYNHSPLTSDISYLNFYSNYILYYFSDLFFAKHICYKLSASYNENWMKDAFKNPANELDQIASNRFSTLADSLLETNFKEYKLRFKPDYSFNQKSIRSIDVKDQDHLKVIKELLDKNSINYKVIVPPDFHKKRTPLTISNYLNDLFGNNLYDFTGLNEITSDSSMNYENLHFTYRAGKLMLEKMYASK